MKSKIKKVSLFISIIAILAGILGISVNNVVETNNNGLNISKIEKERLGGTEDSTDVAEVSTEQTQQEGTSATNTTTENNPPQIQFAQIGGEVLKNSSVLVNATDYEGDGISKIKYHWDYFINSSNPMIASFDELKDSRTIQIPVPEEEGLHLLRVSAIDGKENHSDWYIIPYYVVTAKSETQDTTPPVFNWDSVEEVPRSGETINLGRDITIRAEDEESGVYYIAYLWTEDGQTPNAADYTIVNQPVNGAITIKAPNTPGNWVLRVCAANSSYNSSTGVFYTSKVTYFKYEIKDIEAPTMTLNGEAVVRVPLNGNFVDEGVTVTDNVDEQKIIYSEDVVETSEIGTHTITYTATDSAGNTSTITREVIIEGLNLEDTQIQISNTEVEYDGNEQNISVQLPEGAGAPTITYYDLEDNIVNNPKNAGTYKAILSITQGTKYYGLEKEITSLVIKPRNITIEIGTINTTYGDAEVTEIPTSIVSGEIVEGESLNLTFTREEGTNVGEYSISGNANNENYNVTVEDGLYVIAQKEIEIIINGVTVTYGEIENETTYIIPEGSIVGEDEIGLSISRETGNTVGKYKITAAITNTNYKLSQNEAIYEITKRPITIKAQDKTVTYGESAELQYNITSGNIVNEDELNIKISRETGEDVGEYVITVTAENSNYDITLENGTYKITPKDATIDVLNIVNEPKTYNGNPQGIEVSVKEGINGLGHIKVCYDGVETIPTNAGTYKVTIDIEAGANYEEQKGIEVGNFVINQKEIGIEIQNQTSVYGDEEKAIDYILDEEKIVGEDEIGLNVTREQGNTVGEYDITATITNPNYKLTQNEAIYEITKRPITISAVDKTVTYGESANLEHTITSGNIVNEDELNIQISRETGEDVGEYVITVTAENSNYEITLENGTYKITPKDASQDLLNIVNEPKTYNGDAQGIEASVKEGINGLGHIKIYYDGVETIPTNAGTYKVTIDIEAGKNYNELKGSEVGNFVINQKEIGIEIQNQTSVYGDEEKAIDYTLDEEKIIGEDDLGLNVSKAQGNTVGKYKITASITNTNYKLSQNEAVYEITKRPITIDAVDKTVTYGESAELQYNITSGNIVNEDNLNIQTTREPGEDVGEYVITVTAENSNYEITLENGTYKINPKDASQDLLNIVNEPKTYNGKAQGIEVSVKEGINGLGNIKVYYDGAETIPANAGTYKVTIDIEAGKNYNELKAIEVGNFVINKRQIEIEIGTVNATYGDAEVTEIPTSIVSGEIVEGESLNLTFTREEGTAVGQYAISGNANNENYDVTVENGLYVIAEKEIQISIDNISQIYGDDEKTITYKIPDGSIVGEDDIGLNVTREQGKLVGKYKITAAITNTNYKLTQNEAIYEITKRPITIDAVDKTVTYGESAELQYNITSGNIVNEDNLNIQTTREPGEDVGEYVITVTAENSNYDITLEKGIYKIVAKNPALDLLNIVNEPKTYNGNPQGIEVSVKEGINGLGHIKVYYDGAETVPTNAGTYKVTIDIEAGQNYGEEKGIEVGNFVINPKEIGIEIQNQTSVYGDEEKTLAYTLEEEKIIGEDELGLNVSKAQGNTVGNYDITATITNTNYSISQNEAKYEITKRPITIKASDITIAYGNNPQALIYKTNGNIVNEDNLNIKISREDGEDVGEYVITVTAENSNYDITLENGIYKITPIDADISLLNIVNEPKTYNGNAQGIEVSVKDGIVGLGTVKVYYNGLETIPTNAGTYKVTIDIEAGKNYNELKGIEVGNFVINPKAIEITIENQTSIYGDEEKAINYTLGEENIIGEDDLGLNVTREQGNTVGKYKITAAITNTNYKLSQNEAVYEITKRPITIDAVDKTVTYGESEELEYNITSGNIVNEDNLNIQTTREPGEDVGEYVITVTAENSNYDITLENGTYKINPKDASQDLLNIVNEPKTYNGNVQGIEVSVKEGINGLGHIKVYYDGAETVPANAGTYKVTIDIEAGKNYNELKAIEVGNFVINKRQIEVEIGTVNATYGDAEVTEIPTSIVSGEIVEGESLNLTFTREEGTTVGQYAISGNANNENYDVKVEQGLYLISEKEIQISIDNISQTYGETEKTITYTIPEGSIVGEDDIGLNVTREQGKLVGKYKITAAITNTNYKLSQNEAIYEITKRPITISAVDKTVTYGESAELEYNITSGNIVNEDELNIQISRETGEDVGEYVITVTAENSNYEITLENGVYKIIAKNPALDLLNIVNEPKTYNGNPQGIEVSVKDEINGLGHIKVYYDGAETIPTNAGTYKVTIDIEPGENYAEQKGIEVGNFVINQKEMGIAIQNQTSVYGDDEKAIVYTLDEENIIGEDELGLNVSKAQGNTVGRYNITATITNTNYKLTQNEAIYEITKRPITIEAVNKTVTYGESAELEYNITSGNIVNEDELNIQISRETGEDVGEYVITVTAENSNYDITLENGTYKITPIDADISLLNIVNEPKTYNGEPQGIGATKKEGIIGLGAIKLYYNGEETIPTNAGTYKVTIDIEEGQNYNELKGIEVGNFVINQKEIGIEIQNQTSVYGETEKAIDYTLDEEKIVGEDDLGLNVSKAQGNTVGKYKITASITNTNYRISQNEAVYEITKRPITISAVDKTVTYGESAELEYNITSGNIVNEDNLNIQTTREPGEDVGEYVITVTAENSNYDITLENGVYKIIAKNPAIDLLNIVNEPKTYNGNAQGIEVSVKDGIVGLGAVKVYYNGEETVPTNAGTYKVTIDIEAGKNYNEVKELEVGNFVINKRQIEIEIGTVNATYGDEEVSEIPTSITSGELVEGESLNLTFTREQGTDVGEYVISGQANNENYDVTVEDGLYVIAEKEIQITIDSITQTYGETEKTITYKIPDGSIVGEDDIGLNVTREQGNIVGEYDITAIVTNTNYKLTQNEAKYEITKRPITIKAVDITVSYGQKETLFHRITSGSRVNNDELNISVTREEGENVGEYVITVTAENSNYDITLENGVYKIEQAEELRVTYPKASNIKYTQKLKESILTTEGEQFGTFSWKNGDLVLNAGTTNQTVVFTPSDLTKRNYKTIVNPEEEVQITVEKANQSDIKLKISSSYVEIGKNAVAPTLTIENKAELKGTIKYSSSNEKVATINEEGIISLVGEIGKTTITVTSNEDNSNTNYEPATKTIELEVGDKTAPEIIIDNTVLKNTIFEAGYEDEFNDKIDGIITITDNYDTEVSKTITGLKIKEVGTQTITITATDSEGNEAQKNVKIKIIDSEAPTIKLQNAIDKNQEFVRGDKYVRPQFILEDNSSDASNISVERTGFLDMTTKGRYSIKYTAEDEYGNRSEPLEVQVTVLDYAPAIVYVKDNFKYLVEEGKEYSHFLDIEFEGSGELVKNGTEIIGYKSGIRLTDGEYVLTVTNDLCKTAKVSFSINTSGPEITAVVNLNGTTTRKKLEDNTPVFQGITTFEFDEKVVNAVLYQVSNGALTEIASGKENVLAHELSETGLKTYSLLIEDANGETETRNFYVFN